jgi:acetyltransferase-like isoleucine patch superfamily enzyme/acyl carrier protein
MNFRRKVVTSNHPFFRLLVAAYRGLNSFSLPAPRFLVRPLLLLFLGLRAAYYFFVRVFICQPLFKAYCTSYGRGVRTDVHFPWVQGPGRIIVGDGVCINGKSSFSFGVRYFENPTIRIGDHTHIGHECSFSIGREISIGGHCLIANNVHIFDVPGHPNDPVLRKLGSPAKLEDIRPVHIHDNVWIGRNAVIFPGVTIGENSIVSIGSLVMNDVPPNTIVAGNPARVIASLNQFPQPSRITGTTHIDLDEDFYNAGLTSIMVLPLLVELEEKFQISIPEDQFLEARTIRQLAAQIATIRS